MKFLEAAKKVVETKTALLIRPRRGVDMEFDTKPMFSGKKKGWVLLDLFTASAVEAGAEWAGLDYFRRIGIDVA